MWLHQYDFRGPNVHGCEMAQRVKNHEMRNAARKLTPAERRAKKKRKLTNDPTGGGTPGMHLLEAHPPFTATSFLNSDEYDASIHAPPDDGFSSELKCHGSNRRSNGYCGPWRYAHSH